MSTGSVLYEKRLLVTGGAGFIGSHVCITLVEKYPKYYVVNLDKLDNCASLNHLSQIEGRHNYKFIKGDVCEQDFVRYIIQEERIDVVIHVAAKSHVDSSFCCSLEFTATNVYGSHVLVNAAFEAGVKLFLHISTDEVYGGSSQKVFSEEYPLHPSNPYSASKAAAENIILSYWEAFKFPVIIVRPNNVYGPHQYPEKVIPKFISLLDRNEKCCIHGDGTTVRNFLYVSDMVDSIDVLLHRGEAGEIYNVGTDFEMSILDVAKYVMRKIKHLSEDLEVTDYVDFTEDRLFNDQQYHIDSSKIYSLGWFPKVSWQQGMDITIGWYQNKKNFQSWLTANEALSAFPTGSNTSNLKQCMQQYKTKSGRSLTNGDKSNHGDHNS